MPDLLAAADQQPDRSAIQSRVRNIAMIKKLGIAVAVAMLLVGAAYGAYRYYYPFGADHRCDILLCFALHDYARAHGGKFPSGEATPEASLSLIHSLDAPGENAYLLRRRDVSEEVVREMLSRGELLGPDTCGWNYVEGLSILSNSKLALFWDKEGLSEMGMRLPEGGHLVTFLHGEEYVPASRWDAFLEEQRTLLAEEKAKSQNNDLPQGAAAPHQPNR